LYINQYNTHASQTEKAYKLEDNETGHIIQDKIYKKVIKVINNNKFRRNIKHIKVIIQEYI
jgi:hypothetical protein